MSQLKRFSKITAGQSPASEDVTPLAEGTPFLQGNAEFGKRFPTPKYQCSVATKHCEAGDVLVSVRAPVGAVNVADQAYAIGRGLCAIRPLRIDPTFLYWFMLASQEALDSFATGSTFGAVSAQIVGALSVPQVPLSEQQAIADHLDSETAKIDTLIVEQQRLIELLHERRLSAVDRFTWQGLDPTASLSPAWPGAVKEIPESWRVVRNKLMFSERTDLSTSGEEELLTVSHITGVTPRSEKNVTMTEAESHVGYRIAEVGDLTINTMWAWMGALGVTSHRGIVSPAYGVYALKADSPVLPSYVHHLVRSRPYVTEMTRYSRGIWSSRLRLYPESFLRLNMPIPPLEQQRRIVAELDEVTAKIDRLIAEAERFIELSRERRSALITAAVTGQIEIPGVE